MITAASSRLSWGKFLAMPLFPQPNKIAATLPEAHHKTMATTYILNESFAPPATAPYQPEPRTPRAEILAALRTLPILEGLTDPEFTWLADHSEEWMAEPGGALFSEGEPAREMIILLRGEIHVRRRHSGPMSFFVGRTGQLSGKLPYSRMKTYGGEGYAVSATWGIKIHQDLFPDLLLAIPSMGQKCVSILLDRVREVTRMEQQAEKLAALGKLAGNLAHELNNPASAAQRSAASLFTELRAYGDKKYKLGSVCSLPETRDRFQAWMIRTREEMAQYQNDRGGIDAGPLSGVDREADVLSWLERHHIADAWDIAPTLAETRFPLSSLDDLADSFPEPVLAPALATFASSLRVERMAQTILGSTARIFDIISAIKDYSYMDQAPIQEVDLAQALEVTLSMFGSRLANIALETDFDPALEPISAYGSELNQVWTAIIENALDAMRQGGNLKLKTRLNGQMATVEIWDSGPGIPAELKSRIFEPFFTTKAPGSGLGLGLDTAQRIVTKHNGFITVDSKPGETCFQVRLPLDRAEAY